MYTEQQELLQSQTSAESVGKENSSNELVEMIELKGTPFKAIKHNERYKIVLGKWQISEELDTIEEVWDYLEKEVWNIILKLVLILTKPEVREMGGVKMDIEPGHNAAAINRKP